ncbi:hypothetical protein B0H10DRAFT_1942868 [Mycena sp. CBHHK59/15]|nr:hypothetical protein B0H10DRAFT_1942868 [Mycena sp. CBHHK59/15]
MSQALIAVTSTLAALTRVYHVTVRPLYLPTTIANKLTSSPVSTDGWKSKQKDAINAICANVDFKLIEVTTLKKDRPSQCKQFAQMIDCIEVNHGCIVIYFTMDADGGSKKGHLLLGKKQLWLILPLCWAHQFQLILGDYFKLFTLCQALQPAVLQRKSAIIATEVGAATSAEAECLRDNAKKFCILIKDPTFWNGLEAVLSDLEPIFLRTNINQKDSTCLDQVLLMITGIFLCFADHPEPEVKTQMLIRLEKHQKDCDQPVFLLALILNLVVKLSCFRPKMYRHLKGCPDNTDTLEQKKSKNKLSKVFMQYMSGTSDFVDFDDESWEVTYVWEVLAGSRHLAELAGFAIVILQIVANQTWA